MEPAQIILIEDNPADIYLFKFAMQSSGIECVVKEFRRGVDAIEVLCAESSNQEGVPDAIVLDLNTPNTDGFSALGQLKRSPQLSHVPMAVLTSSRSVIDRQRVAMSGARYIEKASDLNVFCRSVSEAVREMLSRDGEAETTP